MYVSVSNPQKHDGQYFDNLDVIPSPIIGDQYLHVETGDICVFSGSGWKTAASSYIGAVDPTPSVTYATLSEETFDRLLVEIGMFGNITKDKYFQIQKLYRSDDMENKQMASKMVEALHEKMTSNG